MFDYNSFFLLFAITREGTNIVHFTGSFVETLILLAAVNQFSLTNDSNIAYMSESGSGAVHLRPRTVYVRVEERVQDPAL